MFTRPFFGGVLVGLAFGLLIGAALVQGVDYDANVVPSLILVIAGMALARKAPRQNAARPPASPTL
jgi:predicted permease